MSAIEVCLCAAEDCSNADWKRIEGSTEKWQQIEAARAELAALRAENARMREALEALVETHDGLQAMPHSEDTHALHVAESQYELAWREVRAVLGGRDA